MRNEIYHTDGTMTVEEVEDDYTWSGIKNEREAMLFRTDIWMLADRYNTLTSEQQTELTTYRQALRDITDYATPNEAADNFPQAPDWL
jgi:hypothetical protein